LNQFLDSRIGSDLIPDEGWRRRSAFMPKSLSFDLRSRVLAAIDGGLSCRQAAAQFGVSASSAIRWQALCLGFAVLVLGLLWFMSELENR
jgi:hypothetical protein